MSTMPVIHDPFIIDVVGESLLARPPERRLESNRLKAPSVPVKAKIKFAEAGLKRKRAFTIRTELLRFPCALF
jgi:hypothetical protein